MVSVILNLLKAQGDSHDAEVACYNGPNSHVVVGSTEAIDALENLVMSSSSLRDIVRTKKRKVTHGFHYVVAEANKLLEISTPASQVPSSGRGFKSTSD